MAVGERTREARAGQLQPAAAAAALLLLLLLLVH
jgi:hypothetical protein